MPYVYAINTHTCLMYVHTRERRAEGVSEALCRPETHRDDARGKKKNKRRRPGGRRWRRWRPVTTRGRDAGKTRTEIDSGAVGVDGQSESQ